MSSGAEALIQDYKYAVPATPAFIIDKTTLMSAFENLHQLKQASNCKVLYSIKALPLSEVLQCGKQCVDGYSVSSLFESRLADEILAGQGSLHLTTPGLRPDEMAELSKRCQFISFNSLSQWQHLKAAVQEKCSPGLRINPQLSFANDARYDPCRLHSKLGVALQDIKTSGLPADIEGLHFHTVFASRSYQPLIDTVQQLQKQLGDHLKRLKWLNLGGGYLFNEIPDQPAFIHLIQQLAEELKGDIYIEPGNAIVNAAGYLCSTVLDTFCSDGKQLAVLDSSVNHNPEVFEYQRSPALCEHDARARHKVILVGSTCLAGDVFGEYQFKQALKIGDRVLFKHVGAYSLIKANRFNGYNLPAIYSFDKQQFQLLKQYDYDDYRQQWMV